MIDLRKNDLKGLGGFLMLPLIALFIFIIRMSASLFTDFLPIFTQGYWEILTTSGTEAYHVLWAPLIVMEIAINLTFVAFSIVLIVLFIKQSYLLPFLFVVYLASNLFFVGADMVLSNLIPAVAESKDNTSYLELARTVVGAVVWIPYFATSKRVRQTFVRLKKVESTDKPDEGVGQKMPDSNQIE